MNRTKRSICLAASVCLLLMLSCFAAEAKDEIRFGYLVADQLHSPAVMIMKEKKLLEAEGLKVNWGEYLAGSYLMQFMTSGEVDFGSCGAPPVMITRGQGVKVSILASSNTEGSSLVVKDSIKSVKDLDGKKIGTPGIGSIQDALIDRIAQQNNIKIIHKSMKVSDMPVFLQKGEIDGFIAWAPHPARAVDLGYGHELLTSHDILPGHQCCVLIAREELVQKDPETVKKVMTAYLKAFDYFRANFDECVALMAKMTGMKEEVVRLALKTTVHPYPPDCDIPSIKMMTDTLVETGKIEKGSITSVDDLIKTTYHPEFMEECMKAKK
ncbi:MAG: ABC transporter substrate-binding protein [Syntrophobacteraceae bacterium]|nr:ABC transporter substrate-binding protein [Desulfobacteraceae bacterium]